MRKLGIGVAVSLIALALTACAGDEPDASPLEMVVHTPAPTDVPGSCGVTLCCSTCPALPVSRVIDGDTFVSAQGQRVRLFGVDTPERGESCFHEATERLRELAAEEVRVELGPRQSDPYGRLLYYVYTEEGLSIDEVLVSEGLGEAWTRDGQHRDTLASLEARAQGGGVGCLW